MSEKVKCEICNKKFTKLGLSKHISLSHFNVMSISDYYDKFYLKNLSEKECKYCGKPTKFVSMWAGYSKYCSEKCSQLCPEKAKICGEKAQKVIKEKYKDNWDEFVKNSDKKRKQTKLEKYGDPDFVNPEKAKATNLKRYGVENANQLDEVKAKIIATNIERYGVAHVSELDEFKEKAKATNLERYGVEWTMQREDFKERAMNTQIEKYGGIGTASEQTNAKIKEKMVELYGVENAQQSDIIRKRTEKTNLDRYGTTCLLQNKEYNLAHFGVEDINDVPYIKEKQKINRLKTNRLRYGVDNISQLPRIQDIIVNNNLLNYGVSSPMKCEKYKLKQMNTCMLRYGVSNIMQNKEFYYKFMIENRCERYKLYEYSTKFGTIIHYQSKHELNFVKYCENNNIYIENGESISYYINGATHTYYVDFKIKEECGNYRLVEIKAKHKYWFRDLENGVILAKTVAAQKFSKEHGYLPFKIYFKW